VREIVPFVVLVFITVSGCQRSAIVKQQDVTGTAAPDVSNCPDPNDPAVHYVSADSDACSRLRFFCLPGTVPFSNECGCGCKGS
jgi:hypothetical protein